MRDFSILKQRILQFLDIKGITKYKFYQETGIANGILSQKNGLTEENIERFLSTYPEVSSEWFLRGKGEMFVSKDGVSKAEECKQTDNVEEENISRRLDDMEKREAQRDFLLTRIADTLDGISKILAHLPENPEKESGVKNHSSLCG